MNSKKCSKCKELLPSSEFCKHRGAADGLHAWCRKCESLYYLSKRVDILKRQKTYSENSKNNPEFVDQPQQWYYKQLFYSSKNRVNCPVNLTYKEFVESYNPICALSGRPLFLTKTRAQAPGNQNASIDRIDSSGGYEVGNIQWVDFSVNRAKERFSQSEFKKICQDVADFSRTTRNRT